MEMECAKRGRRSKSKNTDSVQLLPDKLLKLSKNKNKNINVNVISIGNVPVRSRTRAKSRSSTRQSTKRLVNDPIRLQGHGSVFASAPSVFNLSTYGQPSSAIQPAFHVPSVSSSYRDPGQHTYSIRSSDIDQPIQERVNPTDITPINKPSIRAIASRPAPTPNDSKEEVQAVNDVEPFIGENPLGNIAPVYNSFNAVPSSSFEPLMGERPSLGIAPERRVLRGSNREPGARKKIILAEPEGPKTYARQAGKYVPL
jgi:hypothetical protein